MRTSKLIIALATVFSLAALTSCGSFNGATKKATATTLSVSPSITTQTAADLDVAPSRVSYTLQVTDEIRNGGTENIIKVAQSELLEKNGNADVLVERQYTTQSNKKGEITQITISGRPAKYINFRTIK
jgi:hypothetical protein